MEIPAPATLAQHLTVIESVPASTRLQQYAARPAAQQKRGVKPVLIWCWASVADSGPELDQHWVNVSCLLGVLTGHIMFCTSPGVKILKLLPNWLSLKTIFYCRYKKTGSTTSKYTVSTVHRSHLLTFITKAIDTTYISYQPLWLCCWRGDISSFLFTKKTRLIF